MREQLHPKRAIRNHTELAWR
ncbi:MAG: hypothetical protein AVDCRST_MAG01-01-3562, partial [uncultured Rubrobacteraceae bacterium]